MTEEIMMMYDDGVLKEGITSEESIIDASDVYYY
jgi:hypothetical protein